MNITKTLCKMASTQYPISSLPLPPTTHILTHNLTPDPHIPSVSVYKHKVLVEQPSLQRRARLLSPESHFSYVSPFPVPFPYDIDPPSPDATDSEEVGDKGAYVEKWLHSREAIHEYPLDSQKTSLRKHFPKNRDQRRELIGLAETGLKDCVPHLDVGDAFATLGTPTLAHSFDDEGKPSPSNLESAIAARQELVDVLSGHAVLMSPDDSEVPFAPWSLRYSGHQFGSWAGQLGDGRAISIR